MAQRNTDNQLWAEMFGDLMTIHDREHNRYIIVANASHFRELSDPVCIRLGIKNRKANFKIVSESYLNAAFWTLDTHTWVAVGETPDLAYDNLCDNNPLHPPYDPIHTRLKPKLKPEPKEQPSFSYRNNEEKFGKMEVIPYHSGRYIIIAHSDVIRQPSDPLLQSLNMTTPTTNLDLVKSHMRNPTFWEHDHHTWLAIGVTEDDAFKILCRNNHRNVFYSQKLRTKRRIAVLTPKKI